MSRVRVQIERLVLDGVVPGDRAQYQRAVEAAIAAELARPGGAAALGGNRNVAAIDGGSITSPNDAGALGRHIAGRIGGGRQ